MGDHFVFPPKSGQSSQAGPFSTTTMSTLSYSWALRGTFNGDFVSASGTTDSKDGIATANGTVGDGAPLDHSVWHWGGFSHFGLGWLKDEKVENPCEKYPFHVTRHCWVKTVPIFGLPT